MLEIGKKEEKRKRNKEENHLTCDTRKTLIVKENGKLSFFLLCFGSGKKLSENFGGELEVPIFSFGNLKKNSFLFRYAILLDSHSRDDVVLFHLQVEQNNIIPLDSSFRDFFRAFFSRLNFEKDKVEKVGIPTEISEKTKKMTSFSDSLFFVFFLIFDFWFLIFGFFFFVFCFFGKKKMLFRGKVLSKSVPSLTNFVQKFVFFPFFFFLFLFFWRL